MKAILNRITHVSKIDRRIEKAMNTFHVHNRQYVKRRMRRAYIVDNWNPDEYMLFNYDSLSPRARRSFVLQNEGFVFRKKVNPQEVHDLFLDKGATYNVFRKYYGREALILSDIENQKNEFHSFLERYPRCIIKTLKEAGGKGVEILDSNGSNLDLLYQHVIKEYPRGSIVEELIEQDEALSSFHRQSVNTLRLTTIKYGDNVEIIKRPFVRFGQGNMIVDNGAQGGIFTSVDFDLGIITAARDELGREYLVHPNTGKTIIGFEIPKWEEAKRLSIELMKVVPQCRYVGWDLALTSKGWVMVEGNSKGLFIGFQLPTQKGFRSEYEEMKGKLGIV